MGLKEMLFGRPYQQPAEDAPPQGITQYNSNAIWDNRDDDKYIDPIARIMQDLSWIHKSVELDYRSVDYSMDYHHFTIGKITYCTHKFMTDIGHRLDRIEVNGVKINPSTPGIWWDIAKQQLAREIPRLERLLDDMNNQRDKESKRKLKEAERHLLS